jgi:hypothetical protein
MRNKGICQKVILKKDLIGGIPNCKEPVMIFPYKKHMYQKRSIFGGGNRLLKGP